VAAARRLILQAAMRQAEVHRPPHSSLFGRDVRDPGLKANKRSKFAMKIDSGKIIYRLNRRPVMVEQEIMIDANNQPVVINGVPQMSGGRDMTVGDVISTILTNKKVEQFNTLKAYALAQRFYMHDSTDLDDSDYSSLRDVIERNDQYIPLVLAQVLQALIDAKDLHSPVKSKPK
jgi:hypothetical protein